MGKTKIEWATHSWSPVTGCSHAGSPGCDLCYARRMARRLAGRCGYPEAPNHFDVTLHPDRLEQPLRWRKPRMIFVASMGDLFHEDVRFTFIAQVFDIMHNTPQHTYQILTKRPRRMKAFIETHVGWYDAPISDNIWFGVSVENQAAMWRVEYLRETPAAIRFLSLEPLLGPIDLRGELLDGDIHWVIVGGESGPGARLMRPQWARDIVQQCKVPVFVKQMGTAWAKQQHIGIAGQTVWELGDRKGSNMNYWPEDLRIREYPR